VSGNFAVTQLKGGVPERLRAKLTVLGSAGGAIINDRRHAARCGQGLLKLRHLAQRHEMVFGSRQDEDVLDHRGSN
jgi:hypothetical protein